MRAREFILEAAWDGMIDRLMRQYPDRQDVIKVYAQWARQTLKRQDRIVWFLKQFEKTELQQHQSINTLVNRLQHFMGIDHHAIQALQFNNQEPQYILAQMTHMEADYKAMKNKQRPVAMQAGDKVIKDFGQGWQWVFVDRGYCPDEGRSGRHCGNVVGQHQTDQRILSLRHHGHVECTFILLPDGQLGEMKARGNTKPRPELHAYILWLLQQDFVTGIQGGGYRPGANFDLRDLDPELLQQLQAQRPDFADWQDVDQRRARNQNLGRISISPENENTIQAIVKAIMGLVTKDLEALVARDKADPDTALDNLEEALDYQANAEVLINDWHDEGVANGYYEEDALGISDIPMGLAYVIANWNNIGEETDLSLVFDNVTVEYNMPPTTWSVHYRGKVINGELGQ